MAHLFLALSVVGLAVQVVEFVATRNMVTMSVMYHAPNAPKALLETSLRSPAPPGRHPA
jgi:hypothetical protein